MFSPSSHVFVSLSPVLFISLSVMNGEQASLWETPPELWRGFKISGPRWQGKIVSLYIASKPSGSMISVPEVRAYADRGLEGDRFFRDSWNKAE